MKLDEKGLALVFVLWVLVFISVIAGGFSFAARQGRKTVYSEGIKTKAYYISLAGFNAALAGLIQAGKEKKEDEVWRVNADLPSMPFGEGRFQVFISNDSGKINLNKADMGMIQLLLTNSELSDHDKDVIVSSILDWRDKDSFARLNGAEKEYYSSLPNPYTPRNDNFSSPSELLKVRGITQEIFAAFFKNRLSVKIDENELLPQKSSIQEYLQLENRGVQNGIQTFFTIEKRREMNRVGKQYDHSKININAAAAGMLLCLPGMTENLVEQVLAYRREKDLISLSDFEAIVGKEVFAGISKYLSLNLSRYYTITSAGWVNGSEIIQRVRMDVWVDNKNWNEYKVVQRY
ncbi:type II secretion system protein GspK [uncultured Desulfobacter sp.]|uniref:general secretion pathway protein GspK n=1 Tax=uncultured Desulfobacter sp. TaxID=240139 RepID=UPI002AAB3D01|nr:type II secretion system protein GspK [uncultured Desulfobacter sp.]